MASPAVESWAAGLRASALSVGTEQPSHETTVEIVLALTLTVALFGVLLALALNIHDGRSRNREIEADRRERRQRRSLLRRLQEEPECADDLTTLAVLLDEGQL